MPSISITDSTSVTANLALADSSLLGNLPSSAINFLHEKVVGFLDHPLDQVPLTSVSLGFKSAEAPPFAGGAGAFTFGGGASGQLDFKKPSDVLFALDQFGAKILTDGNYYLALSLNMTACASPGGTVGAFTLGLADKAQGTAALYLPFSKSAAGAFPTLRSGLGTLFGSYRLPTKIEDLQSWPAGAVFTFDCQGTVGFTGSVNMLAAVNPTASLGFTDTAGPICVTAGPSATFTGSFSLSGEFLVRLWKRDDHTLQLGYYKKTGKTLTVDFDGSLGADAKAGGFDLVDKLYGLLGDKASLDPAWIAKNIPKDQADAVGAVFKTAVAKKLTLEVNAEADATFIDQAAFSWNFDLGTAGGAAQRALNDALRGRIDPLLQGGTLPAGVTTAGSVLDRIRETKRTFTLNFLGLFDHASVADAAIHLKTLTGENGQLILTDTAHVERMGVDTSVVGGDKLRRVLVEDGLATVTYAATVGKFVPALTVMYQYFNYKSTAKAADLRSFLDIVSAVTGRDAAAPWRAILDANMRSGSAYLEVALKYDVATATALFLDGAGNLRNPADYAAAVRQAILKLPFEPAFNPAFLDAVRDNGRWGQLLNAGDVPNMYPILHVEQGNPPQWAVLATSWVREAILWKNPMGNAARSVQAVTAYLAQHAGADLRKDQTFGKLRQGLANGLKKALDQAPVFDDDASGLLIMFCAAPPSSVAVTLSYAGKTVVYP